MASLDELESRIHHLTGRTSVSDIAAQRRYIAQRAGWICGDCGATLEPNEPIYRQQMGRAVVPVLRIVSPLGRRRCR